jgi:hypothetical protein
MPAHPITNEKKTMLRRDQVVVFVMGSFQANMSPGCKGDAHGERIQREASLVDSK